MREQGVDTFAELKSKCAYKFKESFTLSPLAGNSAFEFPPSGRFLSRRVPSKNEVVAPVTQTPPADGIKCRLRRYWEVLGAVISDLEITDDELQYVAQERKKLQLPPEVLATLHTQALTSYASKFVDDHFLDDKERK